MKQVSTMLHDPLIPNVLYNIEDLLDVLPETVSERDLLDSGDDWHVDPTHEDDMSASDVLVWSMEDTQRDPALQTQPAPPAPAANMCRSSDTPAASCVVAAASGTKAVPSPAAMEAEPSRAVAEQGKKKKKEKEKEDRWRDSRGHPGGR